VNSFITYVQGNFAADLDSPATKFMGEACLIRRLQQTGPQCTVHREHGVHHLLGSLLDLVLRLIHLLFPSRSWRLRGEKCSPLDMFRARDCSFAHRKSANHTNPGLAVSCSASGR
jgi:hypothetical protein